MVKHMPVKHGDVSSNLASSARKHEFNCKYCGELNHFYMSKKTKGLKKAIWACKFCHHKNRVFFK